MKKWRLLDTGKNHPAYNMAVDEAIMKAHREKLVKPTFRFYQWLPPGLSLGLSQKIKKTVDFDKCRENGVEVVRRLTGGRAIYHQKDELTYSLVINEESGFLSDSILTSYKKISMGMVRGLKSLGLAVDLHSVTKNGDKKKSAACFDSPSRYEIVAEGKKLIGSAQTRRKGIIMQHGSFPFSIKIDILYQILKVSGSKLRERLKRNYLNKATALSKITDRNLKISEVKSALIEGWERKFNIEIEKGNLIPEEKEWARDLMENKYGTEEWNHKL